jgi:hypothetical protein
MISIEMQITTVSTRIIIQLSTQLDMKMTADLCK